MGRTESYRNSHTHSIWAHDSAGHSGLHKVHRELKCVCVDINLYVHHGYDNPSARWCHITYTHRHTDTHRHTFLLSFIPAFTLFCPWLWPVFLWPITFLCGSWTALKGEVTGWEWCGGQHGLVCEDPGRGESWRHGQSSDKCVGDS